jgi:Mg-chelatase subunit ChlD
MRNGTVTLLLCSLWACSASDAGDGRDVNGAGRSASGNAVGGAGSGANDFDNAPMGSIPIGGRPTAGPASGLCEVKHLTASPSTPDMLIVLDRSGSMQVEGRWVPSSNAVHSIVNRLQSQIRFGLALFPDPAATGGMGTSVQIDASACISDPDPLDCVGRLLADAGVSVNTGTTGGPCSPGKIVVPTDLNSAAAIDTALNMTSPNGGTPTPETLQRLVADFGSPAGPDAIARPKFVLLVTDGQPTCPNGGGQLTTQPDIDASNTALEMLSDRGVRTYVIGYNTTGPGNEAVAAVLDGFAQRGGTGDLHHRPVEDEASLLTEFQRIAGAAVSCTFVLDQAPPRADYVRVQVDGVQVNLNDANGWILLNGRTVELRGTTCQKLQSDGDHLVDAVVQCEVVSPQ